MDSVERVGLVSKNCPEYLEVLYAIWHAGLVAVPINAKLHRNEFKYILDDVQPLRTNPPQQQQPMTFIDD